MQIITGVERRRRWHPEEKLGIIAESLQAGASVSEIARRHDMSGLLWNWRRQARRGALVKEPEQRFVPVKLTNAAAAADPLCDGHSAAFAGRIEIALPDGICIRVGGDVSPAALRRVLAALRG
jgi:transposase-like protein